MQYKDLIGQEITVGSYVAYAVTYADSPQLKIGKVVKLTTHKDWYNEKPMPSIKVKAAEKCFREKPIANTKVSMLKHLDRMVVISKESIGLDFLEAIETVPDQK